MRTILCVFLILTMSIFADEVQFRYKHEKGKPIYYEFVIEHFSSFVAPDSEQREVRIVDRVVTKQELLERLSDGSMKIVMTLLEASQSIDGIERAYPSSLNQTQIITMRENGSVVSMLTSFPGQTSEQTAIQMVFPDKKISAGETWTSIKDISYPIPVETRTLYKVTELTPKLATISSMMKLQNVTGGDNISGDTEARTIFDHVNGKIIRSTADNRFQFEIPVRVPGLLPNNSNVKVVMRMQVTVKEIEYNEKSVAN